MKRILVFMLVIVIISAMAVPAFAVEDNHYSYNGIICEDVTTCKPTTSHNKYLITQNNTDDIRLYVFEYDDIYKMADSDIITTPREEITFYIYSRLADGYWNGPMKFTGNEGASFNLYFSRIVWSSFDIYDADNNLVISATEPVAPICDGSSCLATDVNADGYCDDCGYILSLRSLTYPDFPSVDGSNKHYALVETKYSGVDAYMYSVFTSDATYDIRGETPSTVYQIAVDGVADYIQYVTTDGQNWVEIQNSSVNNQSVGSGIVSQTTVMASTFDWYNEDGERFFPLPLWKEMDRVTQGEMVNLRTQMGGTMKILVLCGVGLMALLVVLSLFGKRSLIFRR